MVEKCFKAASNKKKYKLVINNQVMQKLGVINFFKRIERFW